MEILFISHKYPPTIGGMEKQCYELIRHTAKNQTVHQLVFTGEHESKFTFFFQLKKRVKKILKANPNIDIIHLNDGLMGLFCTWLKSYTDIPVAITFHGLDLVFPNRLYQQRIRKHFSKFDAAICVSTATANECIARNFPKEKVFVVPNGVDHELADHNFDNSATRKFIQEKYDLDLSNKKIIVTLGRPVKRKGFSWFLDQVARQLNDDIVILMIGPLTPPKKKSLVGRLIPKSVKDRIELMYGGVNDEAAVRQLLQSPPLDNKVIQTGKLPFEQLLSVLHLADLFVMPNIKMEGDMEGFGLVALEAALCQTVVMVSNIDGIPEAIQDQKNGYHLPTANAQAWISQIHSLINQPELLATKAKEFQEFTLANYGWQKMADGYLEVFGRIYEKTRK